MVGHERQWNFLKDKYQSGQLSHAYILAGSNELGKKHLAIEFAKYANCSAQKKPCGQCQQCNLISKGNFPDLLVVTSAQSSSSVKDGRDNLQIDVAQIRSVQSFLSYKPYYGTLKTVIIDNADRMNHEAQSCFLKTLEEPKGNTVVFLVTAKPTVLLPTIFSRCQTVTFFPVAGTLIKNHLQEQGVSPQESAASVAKSAGAPGKAITLSEHPEIPQQEKELLEALLRAIQSELAVRFQYTKKADLDGGNFDKLLNLLQRQVRAVLLEKMGIPAVQKISSMPVFSEYSVGRLQSLLKLIEQIATQTSQTNASNKLALEILLLEA